MNSKRSKIILVFLVITSLLVGADLTYAQPKIPKEKIPSDFSSEVKEQIEKLYSKTAVERADAALAIGKMGKNAISAIPFLIAILHDDIPREWTRTMCRGIPSSPGLDAAWALSQIGKPSVEPLIMASRDTSYIVRWRAAYALGEIGDKKALEILINLLKDEDLYVRWHAIFALGKIKDTRQIGPLITFLDDENMPIREVAMDSLGKTTGNKFGRNSIKWKEWWEKNKFKERNR